MKVSLQPFDGAARIIILAPPIFAAIYCGHCCGGAHLAAIPNAPVPFQIFVEVGGLEAAEGWALVQQNQAEIEMRARELILSPLFFN